MFSFFYFFGYIVGLCVWDENSCFVESSFAWENVIDTTEFQSWVGPVAGDQSGSLDCVMGMSILWLPLGQALFWNSRMINKLEQ